MKSVTQYLRTAVICLGANVDVVENSAVLLMKLLPKNTRNAKVRAVLVSITGYKKLKLQ
jgi:hypothetical protein